MNDNPEGHGPSPVDGEPAAADPTQPYPPPAPTQQVVAPMLESEARTWSMLVHIIALAAMIISGGLLGFLAPLIIWLIYRQRSALVDFHGKQQLNLQLTTLAVVLGGGLITLATLGIGGILALPIILVYVIYALVISIIAGVKANGGEYYRIPVIIPFIR